MSRGADTSLGQEQLLDLKSLGISLGIQPENMDEIGEQEVIRQVSNQMALRLRNPESGFGLTGNTSNKDLAFLKASVVGLNRTRAGNLKIIEMMKRQNAMRRDMAAEQTRIIASEGGKVPADLDSRLMKFMNSYQFFEEGEKEEIKAILRGETPELSDDDLLKRFGQ